jgi:hypothetical protein
MSKALQAVRLGIVVPLVNAEILSQRLAELPLQGLEKGSWGNPLSN